MKKYIILFSAFVIIFIGILISVRILDQKFGTTDSLAVSTVHSGQAGVGEDSVLGSLYGSSTERELKEDSNYTNNPEGDYVDQTEVVVNAKLSMQDWQNRAENGLNNSAIVRTMTECQGMYAYDKLSAGQRQLYAEVLLTIRNFAINIPLCGTDEKELEKVVSCVFLDHPELFYSEGYSYEKYMFAGTIQKITLSPNYIYSEDEAVINQKMIDQYVEECKKGLPENAGDYEKVRYVYEFIILNTEYNLEAPDNQNICSVFLGRESVCLGYAKAVQYLLQEMGVEASVITGSVITGESHAWNLVKVNGQYYYVDATWGDASYTNEAEVTGTLATINYDYLCITTQDLLNTHIIDNPIGVPNCMVQIDNYYVKEGLYFSDMDTLRLQRIFETARGNNQDCVSIRCADQDLYNNFQTDLLDNQHIFQYLGGTTTLAYTTNDKLYTYTFML